jgi:hypothetical protein
MVRSIYHKPSFYIKHVSTKLSCYIVRDINSERLIFRFSLSLDSNHRVKKKISAVMRSENGIRLNLSLRTKTVHNGS